MPRTTTITVKTEGFAELDQALGELAQATSAATARTALRKSMQAALAPMADHAQALAPVDKGGLKRSIKVGGKLSRSQARAHVKGSDLEVFMGPSNTAKALVNEFGGEGHAPQPYMRPAWDQGKDALLDRMKAALTQLIGKAAERAARRARRKAA